jgi:hypothetical protein
MKSISLNMIFWDDGQPDSTRIRNVKFTWEKLKDLANYLRINGIDCKENLYDFSPEQIIKDSIHVPFPLGVFWKSEKLNIMLKEQKDYDFFSMIDCDAFFDKVDYESVLNIMKNLEYGDIITFDLAKLEGDVSGYIIDDNFIVDNANWSYAYSGARELGPLRGYLGGLGGVYICDTNLLLSVNGFDEKLKCP